MLRKHHEKSAVRVVLRMDLSDRQHPYRRAKLKVVPEGVMGIAALNRLCQDLKSAKKVSPF